MMNPFQKINCWISDRAVTRLDIVDLQHFMIVDGEAIPRIMPSDWRPIYAKKPDTCIEALARMVS